MFMFLCTYRHSNIIIFLAVEQRQAQLFHDQLPVGWGELIRFMFLCLHTHSNLIIFLAVEHLHALLFHDQLQNCPTENLNLSKILSSAASFFTSNATAKPRWPPNSKLCLQKQLTISREYIYIYIYIHLYFLTICM